MRQPGHCSPKHENSIGEQTENITLAGRPGSAGPGGTRSERSVVNSGRTLFRVAPPVRCPHVVWMIVSPRSSHSLGILVVRHDIAVVRELLVADGTRSHLLDNLAIEQFPHFCGRSGFPSTRCTPSRIDRGRFVEGGKRTQSVLLSEMRTVRGPEQMGSLTDKKTDESRPWAWAADGSPELMPADGPHGRLWGKIPARPIGIRSKLGHSPLEQQKIECHQN